MHPSHYYSIYPANATYSVPTVIFSTITDIFDHASEASFLLRKSKWISISEFTIYWLRLRCRFSLKVDYIEHTRGIFLSSLTLVKCSWAPPHLCWLNARLCILTENPVYFSKCKLLMFVRATLTLSSQWLRGIPRSQIEQYNCTQRWYYPVDLTGTTSLDSRTRGLASIVYPPQTS